MVDMYIRNRKPYDSVSSSSETNSPGLTKKSDTETNTHPKPTKEEEEEKVHFNGNRL